MLPTYRPGNRLQKAKPLAPVHMAGRERSQGPKPGPCGSLGCSPDSAEWRRNWAKQLTSNPTALAAECAGKSGCS